MPTGHYRFRRSLGNVSSNFRGARPDTYPRFTGLLDTYGGAAAAYSLRALSTGWLAGDVVEVRRSSDSASQGFTASQITNGDLVAFCGIGDGFVSTWYDQSGNGNDATQATTTLQPKIVNAGALVTGGLDFDGVDDYFDLIDLDDSSQPNTIISVSRTDVTGSTRAIYGLASNTSSASGYYRSTNKHAIYADIILEGAAYTSGTEYLRFDLFNGASSVVGVNGASKVGNAGVTPLTHLMIGDSLLSNINPLNGRIREIIIYPSDQSANRIAIEANINAFYSIY
jgi:trimeric autotransporter adhesin